MITMGKTFKWNPLWHGIIDVNGKIFSTYITYHDAEHVTYTLCKCQLKYGGGQDKYAMIDHAYKDKHIAAMNAVTNNYQLAASQDEPSSSSTSSSSSSSSTTTAASSTPNITDPAKDTPPRQIKMVPNSAIRPRLPKPNGCFK